MSKYVIGLDFGSDSCRAILIDSLTGKELSSSVHEYQRWKQGLFCNPSLNQFRQHPLDHEEGLEHCIKTIIKESRVNPKDVKGICVDATGSSPVPVTNDGTPLAYMPGFEENPNAMMVLWKDHTAIEEANKINQVARTWGGIDYTKFVGGIYSSEWFWAKILHIIKIDPAVKENAYSWLEHCDLVTNSLTGNKEISQIKRSRSAAGHKAMWHESWGGLPCKDFLQLLDPALAELRDRLFNETFTSDKSAGTLSEEWADKLGLTTETVVAVGTIDAHAGAMGAMIEENSLVRVMGTSTCDIIVASKDSIGDKTVKGICGQVDGSVIPGLIGLEAGQSAFGDVLAWFKNVLLWPLQHVNVESSQFSESQKVAFKKEIEDKLLVYLSDEAARIPVTESLPIALDWINGRRTPDANQSLKSAISNLSLGSNAAHIFKALVHAICIGSKKIVDRFEEEGINIDRVIGIGGVARKSPYIMQTLSNILKRPIVVVESDYAPALGAAIYAAVAAGIYSNVLDASKVIGSAVEAEYFPDAEQIEKYEHHIEKYETLAQFIESTT